MGFFMVKKAPTSRKSVKSAVVSKIKAAVSPKKITAKTEVPKKTPDSLPDTPRTQLKWKANRIRDRFAPGDAVHADKVIDRVLSLRIIELLEEIRDAISRSHGG